MTTPTTERSPISATRTTRTLAVLLASLAASGASAAELFPQGSTDTWTLSNGVKSVTLTRSWLYGLTGLGCGAPDFMMTTDNYTASTYVGNFRGSTVFDLRFHDMNDVGQALLDDGVLGDLEDLYATDGGGIYSTDPGGIYSTDGGGIFSWQDEDWYPLSDYVPTSSRQASDAWEDAAGYDDLSALTCNGAGITALALYPGVGPVVAKGTDGSVYKLKTARVGVVRYGY